jgi:hypothetical protein
MAMKRINQNEISEISIKNQFDVICQEFNGGNFYGLEYVLEEVFEDITLKPISTSPVVDWFGLNG